MYGFIRIFIFQKNRILRKQSGNTGSSTLWLAIHTLVLLVNTISKIILESFENFVKYREILQKVLRNSLKIFKRKIGKFRELLRRIGPMFVLCICLQDLKTGTQKVPVVLQLSDTFFVPHFMRMLYKDCLSKTEVGHLQRAVYGVITRTRGKLLLKHQRCVWICWFQTVINATFRNFEKNLWISFEKM